MTPDTALVWLQSHPPFAALSDSLQETIATHLELVFLGADQRLTPPNTRPPGLFLLIAGELESQTSTGLGQTEILFPGAVLFWAELLLQQPIANPITALTAAELWLLPQAKLTELINQHPELSQALSQQLAVAVTTLTNQLSREQERQQILRPYIVPQAKRGIIGKSRYAVQLRQQIKTAAQGQENVLIFGEPGLEKDNIAALIHFGSRQRRQPLIKIACDKLQLSGAELFGRSGGKTGLLAWVGTGTIILNNIQDLPAPLWPAILNLLKTNTYQPVGATESSPEVTFSRNQARIILIAEKADTRLDKVIATRIKVPPLRVRKADIEAHVDYYISLICRARCCERVSLTPEALRRLQSYDFPGNLRELAGLVERAVNQRGERADLTEEVFWAAEGKKRRFRVNLLNVYPRLRSFLRSPAWPNWLNYGITTWVFAAVVAILFCGPQTRDQNFALNLFWCWWWPLILIGFPFVGRLWCAVCPFMIYGELTQKLSLWLFPRTLEKWPRQTAEKYGAWFLFALFALIFLWEELWDLPNTAYLSSWLLLLITGGAVIGSLRFERRFWCRYLCPIGGMNGLFAKLSMTELRAQQGTCGAECSTYQCYKGGPALGEGLETNGCPLYSHPAQLVDNRDCVLCMTCLQACPHRSVALNLRPPGIELWTTHTPRPAEIALLLLLLGGIFLHHLPDLEYLSGFNWHLENFWFHGLASVAVLGIAALIPILAYGVTWLFSGNIKPRPWLELAYGYLPLVWAGNLAHYLPWGLGEGGKLLPVAAATIGFNGISLPILVAHPAVIAFLQGVVILFGLGVSLWLSQRITRQSLKLLLPHQLGLGLVAGACWWILLGTT
ncbi:sigma 54-interacting transcriptional regulator [Thermosynechococcaceae cyanobacterium BACA0444]|uniref:Sigma 54-interacting transcriptional regulator n=1 Tax=Pseudocalidococcus azoricus BACA0444 TaxID=2918990 RepID=A0AAE4FR55_9CYAN|nr:sigma 54-interacting transcriptional regulator [Pseudocalidococcus azoricus]MDS3859495.1 sigma 54-interacting transcriptional regulator [Pseudocalidococcus azoricus BACA0444]